MFQYRSVQTENPVASGGQRRPGHEPGAARLKRASPLGRVQRGIARYGARFVLVAIGRLVERLAEGRRQSRRWQLMLFCRAVVGCGTRIGDGCYFSPGAPITIGEGVFIGRNGSFYIEPRETDSECRVSIGERTWISEGFLLCSMSGVQIGRDVLIGEYVSIRDLTHAHDDPSVPIREQGDVLGRVVIGDNVWIGRGCLIQGRPEGVVIGDGAIVGANSVVTRSIPSMEVWGGVPARFIKKRGG